MANLRNLPYAWASSTRDWDGQWATVGGVAFLLRPATVKNRALMVWMAKHNVEQLRSDMSGMPDMLADCVVLGWGDDFRDAEGQVVAFDVETARELFTLHPEIAREVFMASLTMSANKDEATEAEADNLKKTSAG